MATSCSMHLRPAVMRLVLLQGSLQLAATCSSLRTLARHSNDTGLCGMLAMVVEGHRTTQACKPLKLGPERAVIQAHLTLSINPGYRILSPGVKKPILHPLISAFTAFVPSALMHIAHRYFVAAPCRPAPDTQNVSA